MIHDQDASAYWAQISADYEARIAELLAEVAALRRQAECARSDALRLLSDLFSESAHETWTKEEIVNVIEDAIRLGSPRTLQDGKQP